MNEPEKLGTAQELTSAPHSRFRGFALEQAGCEADSAGARLTIIRSNCELQMEPEAEDPDNDNLVPWSGSDGVSESLAESFNEDDVSDSEYPLDTQPPRVFRPEPESAEHLQSQGWESAGEQRSPPEESGSEEDVLYQEEDEVYLSGSRGSVTESPHNPSSPTSLSPQAERHDSKPPAGQTSQPHSPSSSSLGCAADMTLALTLTTQQPVGASMRQRPGTGNGRDQSSEEGGSSEAPPASVFFGISDEGAEQAEKWNSGSDTDLCRPDRHRRRLTRPGHSESQSERHVKETKSKCKRIARLLTEAPNPQNKGALLFKKRRQRVEKYTLVSYGTGDNKFDSEDQIEEEDAEEVKSAAFNFVATSDSEFEDEYSVPEQQHNLSLNWEGVGEMEALPDTKGKGVLMFAQRRKRMDELVSEHEDRMSKGSPVEVLTEAERAEPQDLYDATGTYVRGDQADYADESYKQHLEYQENIQQMNHLSNAPKALVPNRTAKPFLGFQDGASPAMRSGGAPATKKHETRFKVPVPINSNPQVWSPTGDVIASRHERISVPAIKTGILPESKRKSTKPSTQASKSDLQLQGKGERRSYIESEEDCFSLGAEACNFMQPRSVKLKNPPPVAPKPAINPACPPWLSRSPSDEAYILPRSPVPPPSHSSAGPQGQLYLQQQDWVQPQQMANRWAPDQAQARLQTPPSAWAQAGSPSQLHLQPTTNSWSQVPRSPVSMQARSPTHSPHPPPVAPRSKSDNSVASCPPQAGKSHVHASKAPQVLPKPRLTDKGVNRAGDGPTMSGKGAQLFAKRQSRMEKFVVDAEKVQANKPRSSSPTSSLPNSWRYSSNVRAPPPLSYNPLLSPFYPPSATKQPPSASPQIKPKTKEKPKAKHLNSLDIMKHQPYQLDSSLFKYDAVPEAKSPKPAPASKFEVTKSLKHRSASQSPYNASEHDVRGKAEAPAKSPAPVSSQSSSACPSTASAEPLPADRRLDEKHAALPGARHKAQSTRPASTASQQSSAGDSVASAFSPASLIARGVRQMAPWPKFSAKKPAATGKHWRPGFGRSRSLSLPRRLNSVGSPGLLSPLSTPGALPLFSPTQRQAYKPLSPWEAASRSPIGSVDEAFVFQSLPSPAASGVRPAGLSRSLPEPPDEWKRRVSLEPPAVSNYNAAPAFQAPSMRRTFSPGKPAFTGPPFRPAQPLGPSRARAGFSPVKYSPLYGAVQYQ